MKEEMRSGGCRAEKSVSGAAVFSPFPFQPNDFGCSYLSGVRDGEEKVPRTESLQSVWVWGEEALCVL